MKDEIVFKVFDWDYFVTGAVGLCSVKVSSLCINGSLDGALFDIYYGAELKGVLAISTQYTPRQLQSLQFDADETQADEKREMLDKESVCNYI